MYDNYTAGYITPTGGSWETEGELDLKKPNLFLSMPWYPTSFPSGSDASHCAASTLSSCIFPSFGVRFWKRSQPRNFGLAGGRR